MNSPPTSDHWIGRLIGDRQRYRLEKRLGGGGMGNVFLAMDTLLGQQVALKLIKPLVASGEFRKRFEREVALCTALKSDHIVEVSDYGVTPEGHPFYVMEYLQGQTLGELLRHEKRLSVERTMGIITQVCKGLQAHQGVTPWRDGATAIGQIKVVHGDLKPDNIFVVSTAMGLVKILNFGIARIRDNCVEHTITTTFLYAAPEQLGVAKDLDGRADIYSLGIILYEMLSGAHPFGGIKATGTSEVSWVMAHTSEPPQPLRSQSGCEQMSAELEAVVMRCLQKAPDERFWSVDELKRALQAAARSVVGSAGQGVREEQLQQSLELRAEISDEISAQVTQRYEQKLQQYKEAFTVAIYQQYPLSQAPRQQLQQLQQSLGLRAEIIALIELRVSEGYTQKLQQYEQEINARIHQQYPLSQDTRQQLQQLQQSLELKAEIIDKIEAQVTQGYEQKLQQYKKAFTRAIQRQYPLSDEEHEVLSNLARSLKLSEKITASIEAEVTPKDNLKPSLIPDVQQGGKKKVRRHLLKATFVTAALVSGGLAYYTHINWQDDQYAKAALEKAKVALDSAKILKEGKNYEECVNKAKVVPPQTSFYADAQNLLNECQRLAQDDKWLAQAKELAKKNNFSDAITAGDKIQPDSKFRQEAALLISQWSDNLLKQAEERYKQSYNSKDMENAIDITKAIPTTSSVAKNAESTSKKWLTEWKNNENYLKAAQNALKQGKWQEAIDTANKVRLLGQEVKGDTFYWQNKMKPIIETAQKNIAASKSQESGTNEPEQTEGPPLNNTPSVRSQPIHRFRLRPIHRPRSNRLPPGWTVNRQ